MSNENLHLATIDSLLPRGTVAEEPGGRGVYFAFWSEVDPSRKTTLNRFQEIVDWDRYFEENAEGAAAMPACCRLFDAAFDEWVDRGCENETIFIRDPRAPA